MSSDEQAIRDLVGQWHRATAAGDIHAVLALMAADVVFLVPGASPMVGRDAFADALRPILQTHHVESSGDIQEIQVSGDMAYCWSFLRVNVVPLAGGKPMHREGHALSVLRKQPSGAWEIVRDANLLAASR